MDKDKPAGPAHEQQASALHTAKGRLEYLTPNDWSLILDKSKKQRFKKGDRLVEQGKQGKVLYILGAGKVSISVGGARIAQIGPGEICGDMAFLENSVASATAIAEDEVEVHALEWASLESLFELFPHLASRFYRSLAVNLSRRLRDQIGGKRSPKEPTPHSEPPRK
jgi:CRP-like cAMP-binding protein